jgi:hypothetical protein
MMEAVAGLRGLVLAPVDSRRGRRVTGVGKMLARMEICAPVERFPLSSPQTRGGKNKD